MISSPLLPELRAYINGQWVGADSGETMTVHNPATGELLAAVPQMGKAETLRAVAAAEQALNHPATIEERQLWLARVAEALGEDKQEFGRIITLENGKPWREAQVEVDYAAGFFRYCAAQIEALRPHHLAERPRNHSWTVYHRPAGVAALITPWNFPLAMVAKKLSAALAADCPTVIKPSEKTPLSLIALCRVLETLGLPPGKANLVIGDPTEIGQVMCEHPSVRVISFTGSTAVGRKLLAASAPHIKRLALELGGNAPFVVFEDADLDNAADHLLQNKFRGAGQTCVCANRVYVHRRVADAFTGKFVERVERLKVGNGLDDETDIGPLIDRNGFEKVSRHLQDALDKGARRVTAGGKSLATTGYFFPPTVLRGVTHEMACVREETFGPLVPIIEFDDESEVIERCNDTEYGLAAYVFTADKARAERLLARLRFGHAGFNTGIGPTPEAPFGGMKQSGFGREGGREGLFEFVETQTIPTPPPVTLI